MNSTPNPPAGINILDLTSDSPIETTTAIEPSIDAATGVIPAFGSKESTVQVKTFEDYQGKSKQLAIDHALELSTDGCLYTVEREGRDSYKQVWAVRKGHHFGALMNYHNGGEVTRPHLEAAAIATYKAMFGDASAEFLPVLTLAEFDAHLTRRRSGDCTGQEVIDLWHRFKQSMDTIQLELNKLTKDKLTQRIRCRNDLKKDQLVGMVLNAIRDCFHPGWYSGGSQTWGHGEDIMDTIDGCIHEWTDELIESVAAARRAKLEARKEYLEKATTNPESLDEFHTFFRVKGEDALTPELQARYEALVAQAGIESRFKTKARKASSYSTELPEGVTLSEIIETRHTRDGHELFVVQLSDRVEKQVYNALELRAKKLGGWYSSYRQRGAVPGFQFKERGNAEKFRSLEYVDGAERVEERLEAKKDRASDRLLEQATTLKNYALERLNADRRENTVRRATMAASIEYQARRDLQLAETMENLAHAIADREVKFVDQLYTRAHVEQLENILWRARGNACIHEARTNTADYQQERDRDLRETDINFALFPYPTLHKDALIQIIKIYRDKPGFKLLCDWLNKDAGKYFHANPQQNLYQFRTNTQIEKLIKLYEKLKQRWEKIVHQRSYFSEYEIDRIKAAMEDFERLNRMNITNDAELRTALREYWQLRGEQKQTSLLKTLMRELVGRKIPNFHPTPQPYASQMAERLEVEAGMSVCEPSCGMAHLIDALADVIDLNTIVVDGYEINNDLIEICQVKYPTAQYPTVQVRQQDFLGVDGKQYDRILANPPFRNPYAQGRQVDLGADIQHVRHMYDNTCPDSRIVAIMGNGAFTRSDAYARDFQAWFRSHRGEDELLPEGAFTESDRPTGVATRMVMLNK